MQFNFPKCIMASPIKTPRHKGTPAQLINLPFIKPAVFTTCPSCLFTSIMAIDRCQFEMTHHTHHHHQLSIITYSPCTRLPAMT